MHATKSIVLLGGTGLVGRQILKLALADEMVGTVTAPTRRHLPPHPKLHNPIVDLNRLDDAEWWATDAVLCALGTTIKQAGSRAAFREVDYTFVVNAATLAKNAGCPNFVLNSSLGADAGSGNFYLKVKGELESALQGLGFASLTLVRPSLLDGGPRPERRFGEEIGLWFGTKLRGLIPARYRPVSTKAVAQAMLQAALASKPGVHVIESESLTQSIGKS